MPRDLNDRLPAGTPMCRLNYVSYHELTDPICHEKHFVIFMPAATM